MACTSPLMVLHPLWSPGLSHFEDRNRITFFFPIAGFFFFSRVGAGWEKGWFTYHRLLQAKDSSKTQLLWQSWNTLLFQC